MKFRFTRIVLFFSLATSVPLAYAGGGMRPEHADHGMVVSVQQLASQAGVDVMKAGGNAVDAAVATLRSRWCTHLRATSAAAAS